MNSIASREVSDAEIKADVMNRLTRKHCWSAKYIPLDMVVNWLGKQIKKNSRRIRRCIEELAKEGYILSHKKGEAISLNPARSREIIEIIKSVLRS